MAQESVFETKATEERTQFERYQRLADVWFIAPFRILWSDWRARVGMLLITLYVLMGTVGVALVEPPQINQGPILTAWFADWSHPLGTGMQGRSLHSLIVHSTVPILKMIVAGGLFATVLGTVVGLTAGYVGGYVDMALMTVADILLAIPGLVLAMVLAVLFEPTNPYVIGIILTVAVWGGTARQIRSEALSIREDSYVEASVALGLPKRTIIRRDLLPNIMPFVLIKFVNQARLVIYSSVALYYLGILPFDTLNWGVVLNLAHQNGALLSWSTTYWIIVPILAILGLSLGTVLLAQGADRLFNPRIRARHRVTIDNDETPE